MSSVLLSANDIDGCVEKYITMGYKEDFVGTIKDFGIYNRVISEVRYKYKQDNTSKKIES